MREGWEEKLLEDVAYLAGRIGWKGLTAKEYTSEGPSFLSVHSLNYGDYVDFRDAFHISQQRYDESPEIMLQHNDILICKDGAGIGKLGIIRDLPGPSTINSSLLLIRANEGVLPKYLYYKLCSPYFQSIVQGRIEGAATPHLYQKDIRKFPVFIPTMAEQKRIVAILDEAFAGIDTAIANTEKNLANARELFESYLSSVFTKEGEGWESAAIGDICQLKSGTSVNKKSEKPSGEIAYVKVSDMNFGGNREQILSSSRFLHISDIGRNSIFPVGTTIFPKRGGAIATNKKETVTKSV